MFNAIKDKLKKLKTFDQDKALTKILKDKEIDDKIVELNQRQLYEEGLQADGTPTGDYSHNTIYGTKFYPGKIDKGQRYDHVTLKDTGAFYDSMKVESLPDAIKIDVSDPNDLEAIWPSAIGLTDESRKEILPPIREKLIEEVRKKI